MKAIELHAANWKSVLDFYDALLPALGAPEWHGAGINAAIDSMIYGRINKIEPPYLIRILDTGKLSEAVRKELGDLKAEIARQRAFALSHHGKSVEVDLELVP